MQATPLKWPGTPVQAHQQWPGTPVEAPRVFSAEHPLIPPEKPSNVVASGTVPVAKGRPQETGALSGFLAGFGDEPLGPSPETMTGAKKLGLSPMLDPEIKVGGTALDLFMRGGQGLVGAAAGALGKTFNSPALERDVRAAGQVGPMAEMGAGLPHPPEAMHGVRLQETSEAPKAPGDQFTAHHASTADFTKFDPSKIGTGEGYGDAGAGTYLAENPAVGQHYKEKLEGLKGQPAHVYTVKVKQNRDTFLDWDTPVGQQSPEIQAKVKALGLDPEDPTLRGADVHWKMTSWNGGPKGATKALQDAGIPGVKYLDAGSKKAIGADPLAKGTQNFVVFDPDHLEITHKNGTPLGDQAKAARDSMVIANQYQKLEPPVAATGEVHPQTSGGWPGKQVPDWAEKPAGAPDKVAAFKQQSEADMAAIHAAQAKMTVEPSKDDVLAKIEEALKTTFAFEETKPTEAKALEAWEKQHGGAAETKVGFGPNTYADWLKANKGATKDQKATAKALFSAAPSPIKKPAKATAAPLLVKKSVKQLLSKYVQDKINEGNNFFADEAKKQAPTSLPMDEPARKARAKKLGFNTDLPLYRGVHSMYLENKLTAGKGIFVGDDPKVGASYGTKIMELWGKIQNPYEVDLKGNFPNQDIVHNARDEAIAGGHDVVIFRNASDLGPDKHTQYMFLKPENLRSKAAAVFDPKKEKSPNLLSASAPPAATKTIGASGPQLGGYVQASPKALVDKLSDQLYQHDRIGDADKIEMLKWVDKLPPEAVALKEKLFDYLEPGQKPTLSVEEKAAFDKYLKPLVQEQRDLYEEIKKLAPELLPDDFDPDYVHHMVKGKVPEFDTPLNNVVGDESQYPYQSSKLPQSTRSLRPSRFYALVDEQGNRKVAMLGDKGDLYLMQGKKPINIPPADIKMVRGSTDIKPGETFTIGGKKWTLSRASVAEKERETPYKYYKDAYAATIGNVVRLRKVARSIAWFDNLKSSPEWTEVATRLSGNKPIPKGYREPRMPLFRGWAVDGHLADLIDDYYGQRGPIEDKLSKINQAVVGTLFWQPVTHALNVATHWTVGRGWDWLNVPQWANFGREMASAVKDVAQQGPITQALLKEGSAQMLPRVRNRDFYTKLLKGLGEDFKNNPKQYDSFFKTIGVKPVEFYKWWMKHANEALWYANDVFMTQRVTELKRKGMSTSDAIKEAEKHIPNYRLPPRVLNSRIVSRFMGSSAASEFGRFHYGVYNSFGHMAKDLVKGTGKQRLDAIGHIVVLGALGMFVWPYLSAGIAKLTGRKGDRLGPRGPLSVVQNTKDALTLIAPNTTAKLGMSPSERSFGQIIQNAVGFSPMVDQLATQATGHNPYTNQSIGTLGERAQSAAETMSPAQVLTDLWSGRQNLGQEMLKQTVGVQSARRPPPPSVMRQQARQQAKSAGQKPLPALLQWLQQQTGVQP